MSTTLTPPFQLVEREVDYRWSFALNHYPTECDSEGEPPVRFREDQEVLPIDGLLGLYEPWAQKITIFRKGVRRVAPIISASPEDVTFVVRIHEWSHALIHVGCEYEQRIAVTKTESLWPVYEAACNAAYDRIAPEIHEALAQLITHSVLCSLRSGADTPGVRAAAERIEGVFRELANRSPTEYHIDAYRDVPKNRIIESIALLRSGNLVGAEAWKIVVLW